MNIKDMAEELRKKWQKKFGKKKVDDDDLDVAEDGDGEEKEVASSASMLNGDTGPIAGLNRKWVKGIAAGIVLLFLAAFWYVSGDDEGNKANTPGQPQMKEDKNIANGKDVDTQLNGKSSTNDYQELMKHNREAAAERAAKNGAAGSSAAASRAGTAQPIPNNSSSSYSSGSSRAEASPASSTPQTSVRPIPASAPAAPSYSAPYQLPSQQAPVTTQATPVSAPSSSASSASEEEKAAKKAALDRIKQKFASAIGFNLKEGGAQGSDGGEGTAKTVNSAAPADAANAASNSAASGSGSSGTPTNVHSTYTAPTSNMIMSGTVIPVMLLTGINSDAPGQVMAQVQADVYDYFGTTLLIPAGSRLMGTYDQKATNGRVNLTFNTLQLTNGGTWSIGDSIVAVDGAGYMGISGKVTHHTAKKFGAGLLKSALNALSTVGADRVTIDTSAFLHDDEQNIKDTVTVKPGYQFDVYVTNNISF